MHIKRRIIHTAVKYGTDVRLMKPRVGGQRHDVGGRTGHIKGNISELLKSTSSDHINNRLQRNYSGFRALTHVWRRRADLLKFEAAPLCDCDMRI